MSLVSVLYHQAVVQQQVAVVQGLSHDLDATLGRQASKWQQMHRGLPEHPSCMCMSILARIHNACAGVCQQASAAYADTKISHLSGP